VFKEIYQLFVTIFFSNKWATEGIKIFKYLTDMEAPIFALSYQNGGHFYFQEKNGDSPSSTLRYSELHIL